jgi:hypothetical protein
MTTGTPILEANRISKRYGPVTAFAEASLTLHAWKVACLPGREPAKGHEPFRQLDGKRARSTAFEESCAGSFGLTARDVPRPVATLSGGQRQAVAIARAIHFDAEVIVPSFAVILLPGIRGTADGISPGLDRFSDGAVAEVPRARPARSYRSLTSCAVAAGMAVGICDRGETRADGSDAARVRT